MKNKNEIVLRMHGANISVVGLTKKKPKRKKGGRLYPHKRTRIKRMSKKT